MTDSVFYAKLLSTVAVLIALILIAQLTGRNVPVDSRPSTALMNPPVTPLAEED